MSSRDRLSTATETGILPADSVRAALGNLGATAAEALQSADAVYAPDRRTILQTFAEQFEHTWRIAADLYDSPLGLTVPDIESFDAAGYDVETLAISYDYLCSRGLAPEIVIAPQLTVSHTNLLLSALATDTNLPNQRLSTFDERLNTSSDLNTDRWVKLAALHPTSQPIAAIPSSDRPTPINWTLGILPGCSLPLFQGDSYSVLANATNLPSLSQLMALHCQRLQAGADMVDSDYWSWARSLENPGTILAPAVRWNPSTGRIDVCSFRSDGSSGRPDIGTRPVTGFGGVQ